MFGLNRTLIIDTFTNIPESIPSVTGYINCSAKNVSNRSKPLLGPLWCCRICCNYFV